MLTDAQIAAAFAAAPCLVVAVLYCLGLWVLALVEEARR